MARDSYIEDWKRSNQSGTIPSDTQGAVAKRARDRTNLSIYQPVVANLERLEVSVDQRARRVARPQLLAILRWGLDLDRDRIDSLAWLYDGQPLTPDEAAQHRCEGLEGTADTTRLRQLVLQQLREGQEERFSKSGKLKADATILSGSSRDRLSGSQVTLELEEEPGQRLFVSGAPSHLVNPREWLLSDRATTHGEEDVVRRERALGITRRRCEIFYDHLKVYGERSIHSKAVLERYLQEEAPRSNPLELRRAQIKNWISLLRNPEYQHYEIALADETPSLEMEIKSTKMVLMRGSHHSRGGERANWGPHYVLWRDPASVLEFYLGFESAWDTIPSRDRDRIQVSSWLENLLAIAPDT